MLEQEAHLALDKLISEISTSNFKRIPHIKNRLVAITGRVQKVAFSKLSTTVVYLFRIYTSITFLIELSFFLLHFVRACLVEYLWLLV